MRPEQARRCPKPRQIADALVSAAHPKPKDPLSPVHSELTQCSVPGALSLGELALRVLDFFIRTSGEVSTTAGNNICRPIVSHSTITSQKPNCRRYKS